MKTRITITREPADHRRAKRTARAQKTSISGLIETPIEAATTSVKSSTVDQLVGSAALRNPAPGADPLHAALRAKHPVAFLKKIP
jgi:hypothetical protein